MEGISRPGFGEFSLCGRQAVPCTELLEGRSPRAARRAASLDRPARGSLATPHRGATTPISTPSALSGGIMGASSGSDRPTGDPPWSRRHRSVERTAAVLFCG